MALVLASFQRRAPAEYSLVIRSHPLDWQIKSHRKFALSFAQAVGLETRVCFVDEGDTNRMIAGSKGLVLVNSTTGLTALNMGKPVFCLGEAIYALPGLAAAGGEEGLDEFWSRPPRPDAALCRAFLRLLRDRAITAGNYYTREGQDLALEGCLRLLEV
jgi:capsular polysaccharide export protein